MAVRIMEERLVEVREKKRKRELVEREMERRSKKKAEERELKEAERESIVPVFSRLQIEKMNVSELKDQLKKHKLLVSGSKAVLGQRLIEFLAQKDLLS